MTIPKEIFFLSVTSCIYYSRRFFFSSLLFLLGIIMLENDYFTMSTPVRMTSTLATIISLAYVCPTIECYWALWAGSFTLIKKLHSRVEWFRRAYFSVTLHASSKYNFFSIFPIHTCAMPITFVNTQLSVMKRKALRKYQLEFSVYM